MSTPQGKVTIPASPFPESVQDRCDHPNMGEHPQGDGSYRCPDCGLVYTPITYPVEDCKIGNP